MRGVPKPQALSTHSRRPVTYSGEGFAPAVASYTAVNARTLNLTTIADSGYGPTPTTRIADLGAVAPLALAALWEAGFAFEAGPLSTWSN